MLYSFVKIIARLALRIYCRDIYINRKEYLQQQGPLMLAVNHPNSFLDAIILCTLFDKPVFSLARGDAFKNNFFAYLLHHLKMLPVYRVSEGVENLEENYKTFDLCKEIFKKNGIVLIFSEGRCINEWHLRPLKKGTARLAISSWLDGIDLKVLPIGMNYNSFKKFGKNVKIYFGEYIQKEAVDFKNSDGIAIRQFNENLRNQLSPFIYEISSENTASLRTHLFVPQHWLKKIILFIPALFGAIIHAPLFYFAKWLTNFLIKEKGHYDSTIVGILFLFYPISLLLVAGFVFYFTTSWYSLLLLLLLPFTAWSYVQLKQQMD